MSGGIIRSVGIVSFFSLLQLGTQFALQRILADRFGAGATIDAFNAALTIPSVLNTILTVSLGYVLIPTLSSLFSLDRDSKDAWRLATAIGTWVLLFSFFLSAMLSLFASIWIASLYPGFDEDTRNTATSCLYVLGWQLVLGASVSWLNAIQNARHGFLLPAVAGLVGAISNLYFAYSWISNGILGYAWSVIVSGLLQTLLLLAIEFRPMLRHWSWNDPKLRNLVVRWLPLLFGGAYVRLDPIFDRVIGSFLEQGSIAQLGYAQRFIQALLTLATGGLLTVLFPKLSSADPDNPAHGLGNRMRRGIHGMTIVLIPIVIGGAIFAGPAIRDLLEKGEFRASDTLAVAHLFRVLLLMFAGASIADLLARGMYTLGDTRTPTIIGVLGMTVAIVCKFTLTMRFGTDAIVWSTSLYFVGVALVLGWFLSKRIGPIVDRSTLATLGRSVAASMASCAVAFAIVQAIGVGATLVAIPCAGVIYGLVLLLLREPIVGHLFRRKVG